MDRLLDLELETLSTGLITSSRFWKKPIVIFNSASQCGFTGQLSKFQTLYEGGVIVPIALPTNEFGAQEPGDDTEIQQFACNVHKVKFPICMKTDLEHVLFQKYGKPDWNFNKYLFDREHRFIKKFDSKYLPTDLLQHV